MKGILFGVFDMLHNGHKHFMTEAAALCDVLAVAVAPSAVVAALKGREPKQTLEQRMQAIAEWNAALEVLAGDERLGSWKVIMDEKPDVIFLGYDQEALKPELERFGIRIMVIGSHEPETFKSSLIK